MNIGVKANKPAISQDENVVMENGVQIVHMVESNRGYSPRKFTIKKGVPVRWIIDAQAPNSCASALVVPKLDIQKNLEAGENIIEFTPSEIGEIPFSCSMGMYTGSFTVVEDKQSALPFKFIEEAEAKTNPAPAVKKPVAKVVAKKPVAKKVVSKVQVLKATYVNGTGMLPDNFTVKVGLPVRLEVFAKEDGEGCMSTIQVLKLYENVQYFEGGKTIVMEFTPKQKGRYMIACAMNAPHGFIKVE